MPTVNIGGNESGMLQYHWCSTMVHGGSVALGVGFPPEFQRLMVG
jgi:hypothetical protein